MSAAEKRKKQDFIKILSRKIAQFEKELCSSKGKYEENLIEIESKNDSIKELTKRLHEEIIDHQEKIENEHMNELGEVTKKSRDILNKWIDSLSDRIHYSRHCIQILQNLEEASDACFMTEYHRVRETMNWNLNQAYRKGFRKLKHFCKIHVSEIEAQLTKRKNISHISLSLSLMSFNFQKWNFNL